MALCRGLHAQSYPSPTNTVTQLSATVDPQYRNYEYNLGSQQHEYRPNYGTWSFSGGVGIVRQNQSFAFTHFFDGTYGLSASDSPLNGLTPIRNSLISFKDNWVYSSSLGFDVNDELNTNNTVRRNRPWIPFTTQYIEGLIGFGNKLTAYTGLGNEDGRVNFTGLHSIDSETDTMLGSYNNVENSLFVDRIPANLMSLQGKAIFLYDGPGRFYDNYFVGYNETGAALMTLGGCTVD